MMLLIFSKKKKKKIVKGIAGFVLSSQKLFFFFFFFCHIPGVFILKAEIAQEIWRISFFGVRGLLGQEPNRGIIDGFKKFLEIFTCWWFILIGEGQPKKKNLFMLAIVLLFYLFIFLFILHYFSWKVDLVCCAKKKKKKKMAKFLAQGVRYVMISLKTIRKGSLGCFFFFYFLFWQSICHWEGCVYALSNYLKSRLS